MINLLSPNERKQLMAARTNTLLRRYVILMSLVIVLLIIEMGGIYFMLSAENTRSKNVIAENEAKTADRAIIRTQANEFRSNLATAKYILDRQVNYTSLIVGIANALPASAALDTLTLNPDTFGTPTVMNIRTESFDSALVIKDSLQKSPIFSDVNIQSISESTAGPNGYRYLAVYNVTFSKGALKP
ncbi:MAG: PilN domain-containing protein [Candidatus Saccharimonas sp.]